MGVNVVVLIPYKGINPQILAEIEDIYQEKEGIFKDFNNVLKNVFGISGRNEPYWFDEKLRTKVKEPDLTIPLRYSLIHSSIHFRFGKNSIEVISEVRMSYFIQNKAIQSAMLTCFQEIGSRFNAIEAFIVGDNHPLYFEHLSANGKFRKIARLARRLKKERKTRIEDLYVNLGTNLYEIEGYYKLNFKSKFDR